MRPGQSHLISRCITVIVQSVGTVELQKAHLYSRAARRLEPWQVLAPARARRGRTSAAGAPARARKDGESSRWPAWSWPASTDSRRPLPAQALPPPTCRSHLQRAHSRPLPMNNFFCSHLEKFCPPFKNFAQCGSILPRRWFSLPTFKFRTGKGVCWVGLWGCFAYLHTPERRVWLLSKEQGFGVVLWAKWDPIWAKWNLSGQFVRKSVLELGNFFSIIHCPHVCSALASTDDPHAAVRTAPFEAGTAPGNLLQGKIKN